MKKVLLALSAVLLVFFLAPFAAAGILNIGNLTGILASCALICYLYKTKEINLFIKKIYENKLSALVFSVVSFAAAAFILLLAFSLALVISGTGKTKERDLTLVVLGCQVRGESRA